MLLRAVARTGESPAEAGADRPPAGRGGARPGRRAPLTSKTRDGALVEKSADTVPTAFKVLKEHAVDTEKICPLLKCHFSTLLPCAAIAPHCDLWNFSINLHLAVDIPEGCGITVAGETRSWDEGKRLLFDYSFEHEAWNRGIRPRTCLLVGLWHPDTTVPERPALVALITKIRKLIGEA